MIMKTINFNKITILIALTGVMLAQQVSAQLYPMGSVYFQNQYLGNPAMAGMEKGLNINLEFRQQWTNIPGSPSTQTLTGDYSITDKASVGLNFYKDKTGLFKRTRTVASYAYHLPLNGNATDKLSFGLSLGFMNERIATEDVKGDASDTYVGAYNDRDTYIDGDFGAAYTSNKFTVQASLPNMKRLFKKDITTNTVDRSTFFSAISYKIELSPGITGFDLEPKIAYRGIRGFGNILDAGANIIYAQRVNLFSMYHSSQSSTWGVGVNYQSININGMYTTATSAFRNYAIGNFEVSVKIKLDK